MGTEGKSSAMRILDAAGVAYRLAVFPTGDEHLDAEEVAERIGPEAERMELIDHRPLESVMGYERGGCSPLGMKRTFPVWIDETAQLHAEISVSAGRRGTQILLPPGDLSRLTGAECADLGR